VAFKKSNIPLYTETAVLELSDAHLLESKCKKVLLRLLLFVW